MGEKITVRHPGSYPTLRPQNDEKAKSSTTDQKDISKKENTSKKKAPSEANYYGPGGQVDKPQAHSTSLVPVSASARTNGSKNKKSSSIKTEENMSNFQVQGNLVQKSTAAPADNDVIDLSLDDENSDSASMNPKMSNAAAATAAADLPPPPTPEEAPPVNQDKGSTDQDELAATKDELAQLREEINNLLRNRSAEESLAKEKQKSQEVQKKYETLMQEYTELGKDYRRVSKSLVTATEQQMELQRLLKTEQEKRHEADTHCKAEQEARIKLQKELEKIQVKWIRDVRELKTKLVKSEIKSDPESDVTATAQAAPAAAASVQAESSVRHVAPVKREPAQVKYEEEVWDL
jgi:DNA repair exonuclease SbcCD ATPase subunit